MPLLRLVIGGLIAAGSALAGIAFAAKPSALWFIFWIVWVSIWLVVLYRLRKRAPFPG